MTLTGKHATDGERTIDADSLTNAVMKWTASPFPVLAMTSTGQAGATLERRPSMPRGCRRALSVSLVSIIALLGPNAGQAGAQDSRSCDPAEAPCLRRETKIVFSSTRENPTLGLGAMEIYLMNPDTTDPIRLTTTAPDAANAFAAVSPKGTRIVFDSNRFRLPTEADNTSDLIVMNTDGTEQTLLIRGSSATWCSDKNIAYHASASGTGVPIDNLPGAATTDSDIFILNQDDFLEKGILPTNITNTPGYIENDPDCSPDGQKIAFTRHLVGDDPTNSVTAEIWVMNADGTGQRQLTSNNEEERAPAWSPDGTRILYACRLTSTVTPFQLCVINADGTGKTTLTNNGLRHLTPRWSLDGQKITFHRPVSVSDPSLELFVMDATPGSLETQLTNTPGPGLNAFASWGEVLIPGRNSTP
jgi:Tol biopolymer transport system component